MTVITCFFFVKNYWLIDVLLRFTQDICPVPKTVQERVRQKMKEKQENHTNPIPQRAFAETGPKKDLKNSGSKKELNLGHGNKKRPAAVP